MSRTTVFDSGAAIGVKILDSRQVLDAFRLVGGLKGVHIEDLHEKISTVRNVQVRKALQKDLDHMFARYDTDRNGLLDVLEFERMVNSSTLLQSAVCEFLASADADDFDVTLHEGTPIRAEYGEIASISIVLLNVAMAAIAVDSSPNWEGWQWFECLFVLLFSIDIAARVKHARPVERKIAYTRASNGEFGLSKSTTRFDFSHSLSQDATVATPRNLLYRKLLGFFRHPTNALDVLATISGWVELCFYLVEKTSGRVHSSEDVFWSLRKLRVIRLVRLVRLVRVIFFFEDLRVILVSIWTGMRSVFCGFAILAAIVFLWAIYVRQSVVSSWVDDKDDVLKETFPNMPKSMLVMFRCMVLGTDGSCMTYQNESLVHLLSKQLGYWFDIVWILSQVVILFGILNVIAAVFVVQASEHALEIRNSIFCARAQQDEIRVNSLDRLLRVLIYPGREQLDPREQYAAEVVEMIENEHPQAARKIPNLQVQVIEFARSIQDSKSLLQNAMNAYEAQEFHDCARLHDTPSAVLYEVNGKGARYVSIDDNNFSNPLGIPSAPSVAVEVALLQESDDLTVLLQEAEEVQSYVKSLVFPDSTWAGHTQAGPSGHIWKQSKGLCDEAVDPGPKSIHRARQKVNMKYQGNFRRNRDYCRLGLVYDSVSHLMLALPKLLEFQLDPDGLEVVSMENRFVHPHPLGWRDISLLLKTRVPSSGRHHIMEAQMQLSGLRQCTETNHRIYEQIRASLPEDVVSTILDRLVCDASLDLGITKAEWSQCLRNKEVTMLLDGLGVPPNCRRRMFDLVDIDGSGKVTSSELQEIIRLFRAPSQALELAACHLRLKDVQRFLQTKVGPQMGKLNKRQKEACAFAETMSLGQASADISLARSSLVEGNVQALIRGSTQSSQALMVEPSRQENVGPLRSEVLVPVRSDNSEPAEPSCAQKQSKTPSSRKMRVLGTPRTPRVPSPMPTPREYDRDDSSSLRSPSRSGSLRESFAAPKLRRCSR